MKRIKEFICAALCTAMLLAPVSAAFSDVSDSHWASEYISRILNIGIINGYPDGSFRPDGYLTIGEFISMVMRAVYPDDCRNMTEQDGNGEHINGDIGDAASDLPESASLSDADSPSAKWWEIYYDAACKRGIVNSDDFARTDERMNKQITRYEMARIIYETAGAIDIKYHNLYDSSYENTVNFSDVSDGQRLYVERAVKLGLLNGYTDRTFRGDNTLTRAEASVVILRLISYLGEDNQDKTLVTSNGKYKIVTYTEDGHLIIQSSSMISGEVISRIKTAVPLFYDGGDPVYEYFKEINGEYFYGEAGFYKYDSNGVLTQITDRPALAYTKDGSGNIIISTHMANKPVIYISYAVAMFCGNSLVSISPDGSETVLLPNQPENDLKIDFLSFNNGVIKFGQAYLENKSTLNRFTYELVNGKVKVIDVDTSMSSEYQRPAMQTEQERLDAIGIGINS